ncbi:MAG: hypothetical protein KY476_15740 [Planctomycetes bacterium]|nr:hypothetical protein [Planctomycetota bacterium]
MARKTASRLQKRREVEAAGVDKAAPKAKKAKRKATTTKRPSRAKDKLPQRKRLVWGVFSGSLKEEARFPYDQRTAAEEKLEQLRAKSKKLYFIQPIKEPITEAPVAAKGKEKPADVVKAAASEEE